MRVIISPAKKMRADPDSLAPAGLPVFLPRTEELLAVLRTMDPAALQRLWKCNDRIAALNVRRLAEMDLRNNLTPAILAYEGIQYQYMAPGVFTGEAYAYVQTHLRILSGFYGLLRPFDGVTPYRLEMQAKLAVGDAKDLYGFWGGSLAAQLFKETDCILNLASKEYSLCVSRFLKPGMRMVTCQFCEERNGKLVEQGTMCKMARGEMVRYLAETGAEDLDTVRGFDRLGFRYIRTEGDSLLFLRSTSAGV